MSDYVLQTEDVAVHYGGVRAVDGVEITLQRGQIRGLIGPNGSGKSTVIDAITGRRRLTRGKVLLRGEDVNAMGIVERRRRGPDVVLDGAAVLRPGGTHRRAPGPWRAPREC